MADSFSFTVTMASIHEDHMHCMEPPPFNPSSTPAYRLSTTHANPLQFALYLASPLKINSIEMRPLAPDIPDIPDRGSRS